MTFCNNNTSAEQYNNPQVPLCFHAALLQRVHHALLVQPPKEAVVFRQLMFQPASLSSIMGWFCSRKVSGSEEQRTWEEGFLPCWGTSHPSSSIKTSSGSDNNTPCREGKGRRRFLWPCCWTISQLSGFSPLLDHGLPRCCLGSYPDHTEPFHWFRRVVGSSVSAPRSLSDAAL